jgi:hypothetical protein
MKVGDAFGTVEAFQKKAVADAGSRGHVNGGRGDARGMWCDVLGAV